MGHHHAVEFTMANYSSCNENIVMENSLFVKVHLEYLWEMRAPVRLAREVACARS
jgi:hypothetical protein